MGEPANDYRDEPPLKDIKDMAVGDIGYTVPWAVSVNDDMTLPHIRGDRPLFQHRSGTVQVEVRRDSTGWHAHIFPEARYILPRPTSYRFSVWDERMYLPLASLEISEGVAIVQYDADGKPMQID